MHEKQLVLDKGITIYYYVVMLHKSHYVYRQGYQTKPDKDWFDTLATKIAELRLSELGLNFIPGITPLFTRAKRFIEARASIINNSGSLINEGNWPERNTK